jgi:hypothetical protein
MAATGKLEKMLILAFPSAEKAETGSRSTAAESFEALINPESYTLETKVKTADGQGQGTSGAQAKFQYTLPDQLTFDFLFDATGLADGKPQPDGIFETVTGFRRLLTAYQGDSHEPYHLKLVWGGLIFKGRAHEVGVTYKLFNPDGMPIRAVVKVKFGGSVEESIRAAKEARESPDMTHRRMVKAGDTLPWLCYQVYGDPRHYLLVAGHNGLTDVRRLPIGQELYFPPLPAGVSRR